MTTAIKNFEDALDKLIILTDERNRILKLLSNIFGHPSTLSSAHYRFLSEEPSLKGILSQYKQDAQLGGLGPWVLMTSEELRIRDLEQKVAALEKKLAETDK